MRPIEVVPLTALVNGFLGTTPVTPLEHAEVIRIAQAYTAEDSAVELRVSGDVVRARRKRLYRKLGVSNQGELAARLLAYSLRPDGPLTPGAS